MSSNSRLDIDLNQPNFEDQLSVLKRKITEKLVEGYGYELQDDSLSTWIIVIAIRN